MNIWRISSEWIRTSEVIESCTIVTTRLNSEVQAVGHHRMPVVLTEESDLATWLDSEVVEKEPLKEILRLSPDGTLLVRVSERI